jgi:hypothetical protein
LRSSSPAARTRRRLHIEQAGQYDLPFPVETAIAVQRCKMYPVPQPLPACSAGETSAPKNSAIQRSRAPRPQSRKQNSPAKATTPDAKLLVSRGEAAAILSISIRGVDYYIATKQFSTRRIGTRVLIPIEDVRKFARADHPERMAGYSEKTA